MSGSGSTDTEVALVQENQLQSNQLSGTIETVLSYFRGYESLARSTLLGSTVEFECDLVHLGLLRRTLKTDE